MIVTQSQGKFIRMDVILNVVLYVVGSVYSVIVKDMIRLSHGGLGFGQEKRKRSILELI